MPCNICDKEELDDSKTFSGNIVCSDCYNFVSESTDDKTYDEDDVDEDSSNDTNSLSNNSPDTVTITGANPPEPNILSDVVDFFYNRNTDLTKEHFVDRFSEEQFHKYKLGWAPAGEGLLEYLSEECGYSDEDILSTGLFSEIDGELSCLWQGRYVYPYYNQNMEPVYMIARTTDHKKDFLAGKYAKISHTKPFCPYEEPIWGLNTLSNNTDRVIIAEGIADAIQADDYGFSVISPVTTQFKTKHIDEFKEIVNEHSINDVYIIPDSERPSDDMTDKYGASAVGEGLTGAIIMCDKLEDVVDANLYVTKLPRPDDARKVDLDEFLKNDSNDAETVEQLINNSSVTKSPQDYNFYESYQKEKRPSSDFDSDTTQKTDKEFYDVDLLDVASIGSNYRGENPIEHRGKSKNYFIVTGTSGDAIAYDHKSKQTYTGHTYILHEMGEREYHSVEGRLTPEETYKAYKYMVDEGIISSDAEIPSKALNYVASTQFNYSTSDLPPDVYYATLHYIKYNTPYTISEGSSTSYHTDDYWKHKPEYVMNPQIVFATLKENEEYSIPDELNEIEYRVISEEEDNNEKTVWTHPDIDAEFEATILVALARNTVSFSDLHEYTYHTLSDEDYYEINTILYELCPYLFVSSLTLKLERYLAQKHNVEFTDKTTLTENNRKYVTQQFKKQL